MNSLLLNRAAGFDPPQALQRSWYGRLLRALQASETRFDRKNADLQAESSSKALNELGAYPTAHFGGVNGIAIDQQDGRLYGLKVELNLPTLLTRFLVFCPAAQMAASGSGTLRPLLNATP
jgi:hypothetical protein